MIDAYYKGLLTNEANQINLEYIEIYGLFGKYNIYIPFEKQVNIFIGENGIGKTTILNIIYFTLTGNFRKLLNINFKKINIKFKNERELLAIFHDDLEDSRYILNLKNEERLINYFSDYERIPSSELFAVARDLGISRERAKDILINNFNSEVMDKKYNKKVNHIEKLLKQNIKEKILYLPTYRRIESELDSYRVRVLKRRIEGDEFLIHFGMSDVEDSLNNILNTIKNISIQGYTKMTELLLKQYADGVKPSSYYMDSGIMDFNEWGTIVEIVLERIGEKLDNEFKDKIIHLIRSRKIEAKSYVYLVDLLNKLIDNYKLQQKYDEKISMFCYTCNKYLIGKYLDYNLTSLEVKVRLLNSNAISSEYITLNSLSSGEKQIVSLFAKLYLEDSGKSIVIIDEPELSLSIRWQKMLLPDIMRSNNCGLLLTVTHSPFIFENEYDFDAQDIKKYISI